MGKIKPFKTVEAIAKKHRLDVSFIQKQLDMGEPIEHEHTKDHELAKEIALQHLDEIPDYYTRLKKMEASAKKEHKKFKDVKEATDGIKAKDYKGRLDKWFDDGGWVQTGGKYDGKPCAKQPGQTTKPFCRDPDDRAAMSKDERNKRAAKKRREDPNPNRSGEAKIVTQEENIQEKKGEKDACYHKVKSRYKIWPSAYASGALVKCRKVGADSWGTKSEDFAMNEAKKCWKGYKKTGTQTLFGKSYNRCEKTNEELEMIRYCPKCQKNETKNECKYGPKYWDMFSSPVALASNSYDPNKPHPANEEKDHEYSMARSEISTIISAAKRLKKKMKGEGNIEAWVQSKITKAADYLDSAADYVDSGEMKAESVSDEPKLKPKSGLGGGKPAYPKGKKPIATGAKLPDIRKESLSIEDANGNTFANVIDIIGPDHMKPIIDNNGVWKGSKQQSVSEGKTFQYFMEKIEKSKMKCNSPKSDPVGDSLTGKSHVVKACSGGKEKIIRFGQRGVKGSPKKEGESKAYAARRGAFQARHAKNIAKGPMSAAYWANKVKW